MNAMLDCMQLESRYSAHNYDPLPVVLARGQGAHVWDNADRRYVDMMSAYSAASHGHGHPRILAALNGQAHRLAVPSRAYFNNRLGPFLAELCKVTGLDAALPMNTARGSGGNRHQGGAPLGLPRQGNCARSGRDHCCGREFSRANHNGNLILERARLSRRIWPVHARLPLRSLRRPLCRRTGNWTAHGGGAG